MNLKKYFHSFRLLAISVLAIFPLAVSVLGEAVPDADNGQSAATIYSVTAEPAKVTNGETVKIEAVFSIFDDRPLTSFPIKYFYEIEQRNRLVYQSPEKEMKVTNGAKSHLAINIQASGNKGAYKVILNLISPGENLRGEGAFSIVSPMEARMYQAELLEKNPAAKSAVENRLPGRWEFVMPDPEIPGADLFISKEDGNLAARISRPDAEIHWVKLRKTEKNLVLRSKVTTSGGACWYIVEDVITFNDRMNSMPVQSKILEGSQCVSAGRTSESILQRVE